ncbi:CLUMA_CG012986, isoform A [Clunio marinus]|uniref:Facilitated trehalose transporter Tret1 n=1 Tax=Clunio marinus TaxID=568069 RepID=A0A1J1IHK2_9DIPT|nr:CLUMA_CG012986, isoform A [Clunio marinus]
MDENQWKGGKPKKLPQTIVSTLANGGGFIFGILLAWSAPAGPQVIEQENFRFFVTSNQFAWIVALMALGGALSCVFSGIIRSKIGTKLTILLFGIPIVIGWILITIPLNPAMLMAGRFLCGISAGCYSYVIPIYVGEVSSNDIRGSMLSLFQVCLTIGILFTYIVGHFFNLFILNIVCATIPIFYSLGFLILPESASYLISRNRENDADNSLKKLRGKHYKTSIEIEDLQRQNQEFKEQKKNISEIFKTKSTMKAFIIIMLQMTFFQMSGINAFLFFSTTIFIESGIDFEPGMASIIVASIQVLASFFSVAFVDRFGRKLILILAYSLMLIGLSGIGTFFILKDLEFDVSFLQWLPVTSMSIFMIGFAGGMGPVSYVLLGELFLQEAKAFVAPFGQVWNFSLTFVIGLTFSMMTEAMGTGPSFLFFAIFCVLGLLFTIFVIPETKGKTTDEIQLALR